MERPKRATRGKKREQTAEEEQRELAAYASLFGEQAFEEEAVDLEAQRGTLVYTQSSSSDSSVGNLSNSTCWTMPTSGRTTTTILLMSSRVYKVILLTPSTKKTSSTGPIERT